MDEILWIWQKKSNRVADLNGHIWDEQILSLYEQLEKKFVPKPGIEVTMGNKNVAESGSTQMNGNMPQDVAGVLGMLNSLKQLGSGGR